MLPLLKSWVELPTPSTDIQALKVMHQALIDAFDCLKPEVEHLPTPAWKRIDNEGVWHEIPLAPLILLRKETGAAKKILLGGHCDTAVPHWKGCTQGNRLYGPGTADMKGGLVVLLEGLKRFEKNQESGKLDWEVMINSDEEIGSIGSSIHFEKIAKGHDIALIFEPALASGALATSRKGSLNFTAISRGEKGHAGRDFFQKKDAISPLCQFIIKCRKLIDTEHEISINIGAIHGGTSANVVPDFALCRLNVRAWEKLDQIKDALLSIADQYEIELIQESFRLPKPLNQKTKELFAKLESVSGKNQIQGEKTGGVCDGNNFSALGLATIDTLGVRGGGLHTQEEFMEIDSLEEKADLFHKFLLSLT